MLYLHIGMSKTGSTTIQHFLANTRLAPLRLRTLDCLAPGNSWELAAASGTPVARSYFVRQRKMLDPKAFEDLRAALWDQVKAEVAATRHTQDGREDFVASSEFLYRHYFGHRQALEEFRDNLEAHFGSVRVILYLRDQRAYMRSFYAQTVLGPTRSRSDFEAFFNAFRNAENGWNYRRGVRDWEKVFGRERLVVVPFDPRNFHQGDLVSDFLYRLDPEIAARYTVPGHVAPQNVSPGYRQITAQRISNALPPLIERPVAYALNVLSRDDTFGALLGARDFPDQFDEQILALASEGNAWLNERFLGDFEVKLPVSEAKASEAKTARRATSPLARGKTV